jgi:hypothetical protein
LSIEKTLATCHNFLVSGIQCTPKYSEIQTICDAADPIETFDMRRILNLNQSGFLFVKLIGLFSVAIPAVLYGLSFLLSGAIVSILLKMTKVSFGIALLIFVVFLVLLIVEQIQDHFIDVQYQKNQSHKLPLSDGSYECQYCGNRNVKKNDKTCGVCGRVLK